MLTYPRRRAGGLFQRNEMADPITHATEHPPAKPCPICRGRGALRCDCWPGDCICGFDDEPCDNCYGTGWLYPDDYEDSANG